VKRKEILSLVAIALVIVLLSVFGYIGFPLGTYDLVPAVRTLDLSYNLDGGNYVIYELVARDTSKAPETEETEENDTILKPGVLTDENYTETEEEVGEILGITDEDVISTVMVMQYRLYNFGITPYTISLEGNGRIRGEFANNGVENSLSHTRGVLSMARSSAMDSAGSQFFIMHADGDFLDGDYAAFGLVLGGIDAVDLIASVPTNSSDKPMTDQVMREVFVQTYGKTYEFTKLED